MRNGNDTEMGWPPDGFSPAGASASLEADGIRDLDLAAGLPDGESLGFLARGLVRAAERAYVLSTGTPRPKRDAEGWAPVLSAMGFPLTRDEAAALAAAAKGEPVPSGLDAAGLADRCRGSLPALLSGPAPEGIPAAAAVRRGSPLPKRVLSLASSAVAREAERRPGVGEAWIFGSWARGQERVGSDIDVLAIDSGAGSSGISETRNGDVSLFVCSPDEWEACRRVAVLGARQDGIPLDWRVSMVPRGGEPDGGGGMGDFFKSVDEIREMEDAEERRGREIRESNERDAVAGCARVRTAAWEFFLKVRELGRPTVTLPSTADGWRMYDGLSVRAGDGFLELDGKPFDPAAMKALASKDRYSTITEKAQELIVGMGRYLEQGPR